MTQALIDARWLDELTRAVVLEINAYNPYLNKFTLITIIFEFPSTGAALVREKVSRSVGWLVGWSVGWS